MFDYYVRARECKTFEGLCDLLIADQLKATLSPACLKYCLGVEARGTLKATDLAASADTWDANYTPEGRYRGSGEWSGESANAPFSS